MLTRNYENLLASMLTASTVNYGHFPITSVDGFTRFLGGTVCDQYTFPAAKKTTPSTSASGNGISIGSGDAAATRDDYNLQQTITGGVSLSLSSTKTGCDAPGISYLEFAVTVTNTGSAPITIREVGYKQDIKCSAYPGSSTVSSVTCLIDRTVLETPVTIQAGDAGVINYRLQMTPLTRTKAGVELVSFTWGTDAQICAMIDAARNGDIDLQADGGWRVGDARVVHVDAFTGGSFTHTAKDVEIVITQFGDYNNCGCLFQFDFPEVLGKVRLSASNTNAGGYGATEMYTTTLPAMVEALPSWLKTRLKTFDVLVSEGSQSSVIETVSGNKLALRSEVEVFGTTEKTPAGEGSLVAWYARSHELLKKGTDRCVGALYSGAKDWWLRSPDKSSQTYYCAVLQSSSPYCSVVSPTNTQSYYLSPFGCI